MSDRTGMQIGRYHLLRFLGSGNFAEVYLGQHLLLGSHAAIKILRTRLTQRDIDDFLHEARLVARLVHPHIVRIFDCDVEEHIPYLVLDYAPGGTLREKHPKGTRLSLEQMLHYLKQIADALQYAHEHRIIHRDIKPENMFLGSKGEILLGDFSSVLLAQSSRLQSTQNIVGTATYIAPEQIQGKPRLASDQYALGIVTYEWLTGERPFTGTFSEVISQHMTTPPPSLCTKVPDLPPEIEQVVLTALAKDPQQRFSSIQTFVQTFEQACQKASYDGFTPFISPATQPPPAPPPQSTRIEAETPTRTSVSSLLFAPPRTPFSPVPTPLAARKETKTQTRTRAQRPFVSARQIYRGHRGPIRSIAWSTDSQLLASGGDDANLHLWSARSGQLLVSCPGQNGRIRAVAWSPKGALLASGGQDATICIWRANLYNLQEEQYLFQSYHSSGPIAALAWSPTDLLLASCDTQGMNVLIWDVVAGRPLTSYRSQGGKINALAWSPDGTFLAAAGANGIVQNWNIESGEGQCLYRGITNDSVFALAWSPNGEAIASAGDEKVVRVWQRDIKRTVALCVGHQQPVRSLSWSPDGRFLASAGSDRVVRLWNVSVAKNLLKYEEHADDVVAIAWSPDGRFLASASLDGTAHVWQPSSLPD